MLTWLVRIILMVMLLSCVHVCLEAAAPPTTHPDDVFLRIYGVDPSPSGLLAFLRERSESDKDLGQIATLVQQLGHDEYKAREEASRKLRKLELMALPELRANVKHQDLEVRRRVKTCLEDVTKATTVNLPLVVIQRLTERRVPEALEAILQYLPFTTNADVIEECYYSIEALGQQTKTVAPALVKALKDRQSARRAIAGCIVARRGASEEKAAARKLLQDQDAMVRLRTAQGCVAARDGAGIDTLIGLLAADSREISWQAEEILCWVASGNAPKTRISSEGVEYGKECQKAWCQWAQANAAELKMGRFGDPDSIPSLVLVAEEVRQPQARRHTYNARYWVVGGDGMRRFALSPKLKLPGDAVWLPGGNLLAEDDEEGNRLAVYDLAGKVVWEIRREGREGPAGLSTWFQQPNGGLVVSTPDRWLCEVFENGMIGRTFNFGGDDTRGKLDIKLRLDGRAVILRYVERGGQIVAVLDEHDCQSGKLTNSFVVGVVTVNVEDPLLSILWNGQSRKLTNVIDVPLLAASIGDYNSVAVGRNGQIWTSRKIETRRGKTKTVLEIDRAGNRSWAKDMSLRRSISSMRNGTTLFLTQFEGHIRDSAVEITQEGKVVWEYSYQAELLLATPVYPLLRFGFAQPTKDLDGQAERMRQLLTSKRAESRCAAAERLRAFPPNASISEAGVAALSDPDKRVRVRSLDLLSVHGVRNETGFRRVIGLLGDDEPQVLGAASNLLTEKNELAKAVLLSVATDERQSQKIREQSVGAMVCQGADKDQRIAKLVRKALTQGSPSAREAVLWCMIHPENPGRYFVPEVIENVRAKEKDVALAAIRVLGDRLSTEEAVPALLEAVKRDELRSAAISAIGKFPKVENQEVVRELLKYLKVEQDNDTRTLILYVAVSRDRDGKGSLPALLSVIQDKKERLKPERHTLHAALHLLAKVGQHAKDALPHLRQLRGDLANNDTDKETRGLVEQAISNIERK